MSRKSSNPENELPILPVLPPTLHLTNLTNQLHPQDVTSLRHRIE